MRIFLVGLGYLKVGFALGGNKPKIGETFLYPLVIGIKYN